MSNKIILRLENITKRFGSVIAVDNISFDVYRGELFTLLGPSGCGKTTTLRIIAGLESPDAGKVYIGNVDVTEKPARERDVCLVFQEYAVFPHMSVFDNIAFGLKIRRLSKQDIKKKVMEIADLLELSDHLNTKGGRLGLSEQQKVAIARCLVVEPKILLLDEPLTLADARVRERMRRELKKLQKDLGITMIYVTHDQLEALMLSDRMAVMRSGKLIQLGSPEEIYDNPNELFIATFVGSPTINLLEGVLDIEKDQLILTTDTRKYVIGRHINTAIYQHLTGSEVILGFRPEDVKISLDGTIEGVIKFIEVAGDKKIVHVKINDHEIRLLADLLDPFVEGQNVKININMSKLHIFDKKTGRKILKR
jgi:multiple sugar transport system ATP-binding protein